MADPKCAVPMSVATEELTGFEVLGIEKHFGVSLDRIGTISLMIGVIWALESRAASRPASWAAIKNMTIKDMSEYFPPEPDDAMPDEPDSELGKASSDGADTTAN